MFVAHGPVDPAAHPWPAVGLADQVQTDGGEQSQAYQGAYRLPSSS